MIRSRTLPLRDPGLRSDDEPITTRTGEDTRAPHRLEAYVPTLSLCGMNIVRHLQAPPALMNSPIANS